MKNILMLAHNDVGQGARLRVAVDLVRALTGYLTCIDVTIMPGIFEDYVSSAGEVIELSEVQRTEELNRARLQRVLQHEAIPFLCVDATGDAANCIADAARLADLIIVNRALESSTFPDMTAIIGGLLRKADVPLLAVPEAVSGLKVDGHALVAWDGSPDAAAALRASLPLLERATKVTLLYVDDGSIDATVDDAVRYLGRHGIRAHVYTESILMDSAGTVILAAAINERADLIVMGAFGHGRLRERLFGGATMRMLRESPAPLLLAHSNMH